MTGIVTPLASWCDEDDLPDSCDRTAVTPETLVKAFAFASACLFNFTKRRWPGERTDTYRPCCECESYSSCCCGPSAIELLGYPVTEIVYVKVDGTNLPSTAYELRDAQRIVPLRQADGSVAILRRYQDLSRPVTAVNTMEISYRWGEAPPPEGVTAAAILGWEIGLSWTPKMLGSCRLPKRVTSITRQGVSVALIDPLTLFADGLTGIPDIDLWTQSVNFGDNNGPAELWDPMRMPRVTRR